MLDLTPNPIAFQIGPLPVYWYGIGYALGLAVAYLVLVRLARRAGEDPDLVGNGMIIVAIAALVGGRLYHVIDQWQLYQGDLVKIVMPPYTGLGVYGGIITGTLAAFVYARIKGAPFLRWADIVAPALFVMQGIARWGNFFNQELYGTPTNVPWGIPIDCAHRVAAYACATFPEETTRFHPLFLYESISGILGAIVLVIIGARLRRRLRPGDLLFLFFIWYGVVRFLLEPFRHESWTFNGIPTAQLVSIGFIVVGLGALAWRHRPGHGTDGPPSRPAVAVWGALGTPPDDTEEDEGAEAVSRLERTAPPVGDRGARARLAIGPGQEPAGPDGTAPLDADGTAPLDTDANAPLDTDANAPRPADANAPRDNDDSPPLT